MRRKRAYVYCRNCRSFLGTITEGGEHGRHACPVSGRGEVEFWLERRGVRYYFALRERGEVSRRWIPAAELDGDPKNYISF